MVAPSSGAAISTIIKEVNANEVKGSATGAINFLVFTLSALIAPIYGWVLVRSRTAVFQKAGLVGVGGIALAIVLSCFIRCFIRETGTALLCHKTVDGATGLQIAPNSYRNRSAMSLISFTGLVAFRPPKR